MLVVIDVGETGRYDVEMRYDEKGIIEVAYEGASMLRAYHFGGSACSSA